MAQQRKEFVNSFRVFKGTIEKMKWLGRGQERRGSRIKRQPVPGVGTQGSFWTVLRAKLSRHGSWGKFPTYSPNPRRVAELD